MSTAYHLAHESQFSSRQQKGDHCQQGPSAVAKRYGRTNRWRRYPTRSLLKKYLILYGPPSSPLMCFAAVELLDKPNIKTIIIGGQVAAHSQMAVSGEVFQYLNSIKADLSILGTNAIDVNSGLTILTGIPFR